MGITSIKRDWGDSVAIVRIITTDNLAAVGTSGYITGQRENIFIANQGVFEWNVSDFVLVYASDGWGEFTISSDFTSLNLFSAGGDLSSINYLHNLYIADNGSNLNPGTLSSPFATLSAANAILNANPSTKYNVFDFRKTASENFTIYPNANYYAEGTIISCSGGGLGSGWSSGSANVDVVRYIFDTTAAIDFDFRSFSTSNNYNLKFDNCGSTSAGNGTFVFLGAPSAFRSTNIYVNNFNGNNTTYASTGLNFEYIDSIFWQTRNSNVNSITSTCVSSGTQRQEGFLYSNQILGTFTLSGTSSWTTGFIIVNQIGNNNLGSNVIVANNSGASTFALRMDDISYLTPTISGSNPTSVTVSGLSKSAGMNFNDAAIYVNTAEGLDLPYAGNYGLPYATLSYALSVYSVITSRDPNLPMLFKFTGNVDDTGNTAGLLANIVIDLNGYFYKYNIVNMDASWTKANYNLATTIIKNGQLNPIGNGWDFDTTSQSNMSGLLRLQNVSFNTITNAPTATLTFNHNDQEFQESYENCVFANFNNGGLITFHYPNQGLVSFDGGEAPNQIQADGGGTSGGTSIFFDFKNLEITSQGGPYAWYFRNAQIYVSDINLLWFGTSPVFNLYSSSQIYYDTTMLDNRYFVNGCVITGITTTVAGTGYTHATATATPDMAGGITATAHATSFDMSGGITGWAIDNAGDGFIAGNTYNWVITGDGTSGAATSSGSQLTFDNSLNPQVTDKVILPSYSPINFTPTIDTVTDKRLLYNYLQGIDNALVTIPNAEAGYVFGLEHAWVSNTVTSVSAGNISIYNGSNYVLQRYTGSPTNIDISTNGVNGLDTGTVSTNKAYYLLSIWGASSSPAYIYSLAVGFSPTLPAGYTAFRVIGGVITDGSANIMKFWCIGQDANRTYYWDSSNTALLILNNTSGSGTNLSTLPGQLSPTAAYLESTQVLLTGTVTGSSSWTPVSQDALLINTHGAAAAATSIPIIAQGISQSNNDTFWVPTPGTNQAIDWQGTPHNPACDIRVRGFQMIIN